MNQKKRRKPLDYRGQIHKLNIGSTAKNIRYYPLIYELIDVNNNIISFNHGEWSN